MIRHLLFANVALLALCETSRAEMPRHRPCDIAQDNPGNLNPSGGHAILFGTCGGIREPAPGEEPSRSDWWNAYNCGYQAYRMGKVFGANPYYNRDLERHWSEGWKDARKACKGSK